MTGSAPLRSSPTLRRVAPGTLIRVRFLTLQRPCTALWLPCFAFADLCWLKHFLASPTFAVKFLVNRGSWTGGFCSIGDMGVTANTAMMAAIYGKSVVTKYPAKSDRYICWAKGQIRYILGDVVKAAVVGFVPSASTAGFAKLKNSVRLRC